tara:strand:+ start:6301 stop:6474 length:174 start_codon:yes stop_codon:yes gene_type:complete
MLRIKEGGLKMDWENMTRNNVKMNFKCRRCGKVFLAYAWQKHDCGYSVKENKKEENK